MIINAQNLSGLYTGFSLAFNQGLNEAPPMDYAPLTFTAPSTTSENAYPFLGQVPGLKKWVGDRVVKNLTQHDYRLKNEKYEDTIEVDVEAIEDDQYGVYTPLFKGLGAAIAAHPNEMVFATLAAGFGEPCYDGQYFFDSDHPVTQADGATASVSNFQTGAATPWFLIDASKALKPIIFQDRVKPRLVRKDNEKDDNVFNQDKFVYGVRARRAAGYGMWQTAFGSKAALDATNYAAARSAMMALKGDAGRPLGIKPTHLVVPPALEGAALELLNAERNAAGATNVWRNTAQLLVSSWLAA